VSGITLDPQAMAAILALMPRDEKDVLVANTSWKVDFLTLDPFAIQGFRPFTIACDGGLVNPPSTEVQAQFAGAFIRNIDHDKKTFWVLTNKGSLQEIKSEASAYGARVLSINPYVSSPGEPQKWAAILIENTDDLETYIWQDVTPSQLTTNLQNSNARLIDLRPSKYVSGNTWKYTAVAIPNTGWYHRTLTWKTNFSGPQVTDFTNQGWRLVHIAMEFGNTEHPDTWCFIAEANPHHLAWWWFDDATKDDIKAFAGTYNMRVISVQKNHKGQYHYGAVLFQNT
jgi:hypothetical protein